MTFGPSIALPRPLNKRRPDSDAGALRKAILHSQVTGEAVPVFGASQHQLLQRAIYLGYRVTTRKLGNGTVLMWFKSEI